MAKLYFHYASMNAGKSALLLQADFNYRERGMATMRWTSALDTRTEAGIESRIGLAAPAQHFAPETDIAAAIAAQHAETLLACVLVDEAQFLTPAQVWQLAGVVDRLGIPVLCYGLRTDWRGELFPGAATLLGIADKLVELKAVCHCGAKATMNFRPDGADGAVAIGGNEAYVALCRRHFVAARAGQGT